MSAQRFQLRPRENLVRAMEFDGTQIAHSTSRSPERFSWAEFTLYKLDDEPGWMLRRTGMSLLYHRPDTSCFTRDGRMRGFPAAVDDLPDDAEPCPRCQPPYPEDLPDGPAACRFEFPRERFEKFVDRAGVYRALTEDRDRRGNVTVRMPEPVADLLQRAEAADPSFAAQGAAVQRAG